MTQTEAYRNTLDRLVRSCRQGQGQVDTRKALNGVWNANATAENIPEQYAFNVLLSTLSEDDRQVLGKMLENEFVSGVHEALVVLHEEAIPPFEDCYEGSPFHDFVGRLNGWEWPKEGD